VLVDLTLKSTAGGHVKCWEHFADAATRLPEQLDLTVHFAGHRDKEQALSRNVRYRILRPGFSTAALHLPIKQSDQTDLAPVHRRLERSFGDYDVLHATDSWFAYARTALRHHRRTGRRLVCSTHTDVPNYTAVMTRKALQTFLGDGRTRRWLLHRAGIDRRMRALMLRRHERYLAACDHVLASSEADYELATRVLPLERVSRLRRGIDKELFHPKRRDRGRLEERYGIPADAFLLLYVGRMDEAKRPTTVARAARILIERGIVVHAAFVGRGPLRDALLEQLGDAASLIDPLQHEELRDVYASADVFVFPSATEVMPNVVLEAKASGLPVVLADEGGSKQLVRGSGEDGLLVDGGDPAAWAAAIERLCSDTEFRRRMGEAARREIEANWPSWDDVLREDLLPVWSRVAESGERAAGGIESRPGAGAHAGR
jgi:glycosyltransferase involved in cell wall biosynthesis